MPLVVDEAGMTEDREALGRLLTLADGDLPADAAPYLRVKAVEALGRVKAPESTNALKRILEARKMFGWVHPQELRIAALQALEKLDPEWVREYLPKSGIEQDDLTLAPLEVPHNSKFVRHRRHTRVRLQKSISAVSTNLKQNCRLEIKTASLSGGAGDDEHASGAGNAGAVADAGGIAQPASNSADAGLPRAGHVVRNCGHQPGRTDEVPETAAGEHG